MHQLGGGFQRLRLFGVQTGDDVAGLDRIGRFLHQSDTGTRVDDRVFGLPAGSQHHRGGADLFGVAGENGAVGGCFYLGGISRHAKQRGIVHVSGVAALFTDPFTEFGKCFAAVQRFDGGFSGLVSRQPAREFHHLGSEGQANFPQIVGAFAAKHFHRFAHLHRITDGVSERAIHIADDRGGVSSVCLADADHRFGECHGVVQTVHKRTAAALDVQYDRFGTGSEFFAHNG